MNIFKKSPQEYHGANIDTRPYVEKSKDFTIEEFIASTDPVSWQTKSESAWRTFPIFNQHNTDQCVAFSIAKLMGISYQEDEGEYLDFSKSHLYERRINKTGGGMGSVDAFELARKEGVTLEQLYPTKTVNNNFADLSIKPHAKRVGEVFKIDGYASIPTFDIDTTASIIQRTKKGAMVWFWGTYNEWDREVPSLIDSNVTLHTAPVRHAVTAVDYFLHKGKKALLIEDSWGNRGINGRRIITEDFFKRCYYSGYLTKFNFTTQTQVKKALITKPLNFGMRDPGVKNLQEMLQAEGFFPSNHTTTTFYGALTAQAVLAWQLKHKVGLESQLRALRGHYFGPASLEKLAKL